MATKQEKNELMETLKFTPCAYTISIGGYGGESYAGRVSRETYEYFKENKIDIEEYASDWHNNFDDVPRELQPFSPGSPYDCDGLFHSSGASLDNSNEITINNETGDTHWSCALGTDELELEGVEVEEFGGAELDSELGDDEVAFWGGNGEKGSFFEGEVLLRAPFDPKKLKISYENCDGWRIINVIEYNGEEIDGSNGYGTTGKWTEHKWILGVNVEEYEAVSREDMEDNEEEDTESLEWTKAEITPELQNDFQIALGNDPILTDWFPVSINPVYKGEYEVQLANVAWPFPSMVRAEWTSRTWKQDGKKIKINQWRGLKEESL